MAMNPERILNRRQSRTYTLRHVAIAAAALVAGCASYLAPQQQAAPTIAGPCPDSVWTQPPFLVARTDDAFEGWQIWDGPSHHIRDGWTRRLSIGPRYFTKPGQEGTYVLMLYREDRGWFFITEGESLVLLVDRARVPLTTLEPPNRQVITSGTAEVVSYVTTKAILACIAAADTVHGRLYGDDKYEDLMNIGYGLSCSIRRFLRDAP